MAKALAKPEKKTSLLYLPESISKIQQERFWKKFKKHWAAGFLNPGSLAHYEVFGQMLGEDKPKKEIRPERELRPEKMKNAGFILDHKAHEILHPSPKTPESTESWGSNLFDDPASDPTLPFIVPQSALVEHST